jgi:hypothetical protein
VALRRCPRQRVKPGGKAETQGGGSWNTVASNALYARAFKQTWDAAQRFSSSKIASRWFGIRDPELPRMFISFAPHRTANISLARVAEAIRDARSSVLYSIMNLDGTGDVLAEIRALPGRDLYGFGTTQSTNGSLTAAASGRRAVSVPFSFLKAKVPPPFREEIAGGLGQVIHPSSSSWTSTIWNRSSSPGRRTSPQAVRR